MEVRYPPQKGYLSDTGAIPYENKASGCDTPLCDNISKRYCAIGGVSRTGPLSALSLTEQQPQCPTIARLAILFHAMPPIAR